MTFVASVRERLDARDRALLDLCMSPVRRRASWKRAWTVVTHLGGATSCILAALAPLLAGRQAVARDAILSLVLGHLAVQVMKRSVGRPRPSRTLECHALVAEPDRFSFPSGHSAAAMSVAVVYASAYLTVAVPVIGTAWLVGASRVFLGVHYPGDVLVGQTIAALIGGVVIAC